MCKSGCGTGWRKREKDCQEVEGVVGRTKKGVKGEGVHCKKGKGVGWKEGVHVEKKCQPSLLE